MNAMKIYTMIVVIALFSNVSSANAEVRQYFQCKLAEGRTITEYHALESEWRDAIAAAGFTEYTNSLLIPVGNDEFPEGTFFWEAIAPSTEHIAAVMTWYAESDQGKALMARFQAAGPCEQPTNWEVSE